MYRKFGGPPKPTVKRLSVYLRYLNALNEDGVKVVSSRNLATRLGLNPAQVRKDLAYFGEFGKRGAGYSVEKLRNNIIKILGLQKFRNIAIVGAGGRLGRALSNYSGFEKRNFRVVALFDINPDIIGTTFEGVGEILPIEALNDTIEKKDIEIVVLTVPACAIKEVYENVSKSKAKAVLNFAPFKLFSDNNIVVNNVDLTTELESLSYHLSLRNTESNTE